MKRTFKYGWSTLLSGLIVSGLATGVFAQLQITEVMYNPIDDTHWEWIEVSNFGSEPVDLNGYIAFSIDANGLVNDPGPTPTVSTANNPGGTTIPAGGSAVIYDGFEQSGNPNNYNVAKFRQAWGLAPTVAVLAGDFFPELSNTTGAAGQSIGFWSNRDNYNLDLVPNGEGQKVGSFTNTAFSVDFRSGFPVVGGTGGQSISWSGNGSNQDGSNWYTNVSGQNGAVTSTAVTVPGIKNNIADFANPGLVPSGTPASSSLLITEIMFDPASAEPQWEWVEVYNPGASTIDLAGYVMDDSNGNPAATGGIANITSGSIPAGGTVVLYNSAITETDFKAAWGATLNTAAVDGWSNLSLNNGPQDSTPGGTNDGLLPNDEVALWSSFASYSGDHQTHANAVAKQLYHESPGPYITPAFGASLYLADLSLDPTVASNWVGAAAGDGLSINAMAVTDPSGEIPFHAGGDVGSPGSFTVVSPGQDGDFDGDGDVDGRDFLVWQRGGSPNALSASDLAEWQNNYGAGGLAAVSAVPEPTSLALLALALVPVACGRKR